MTIHVVAFGTIKVGVLGGIALVMALESGIRLFEPCAPNSVQAIAV